MRYTPAGIAAIDLQLEHESVQTEMGVQCQVRLLLKAVAFGELAQQLHQSEVTAGPLWFQGFLVSPRWGSSPIFHVQEFKTL